MTSSAPDGPRLRPLPPAEWPTAMREALAALRPPEPRHPLPAQGGDRPKGLNVLGTLAHHPALARAFHTLNGHVLFASTLSPRQRELLVLRVAAVRHAEYEWRQHVVLARDAGLGDDEIARVATGPDVPGWPALDAAVLRAVDGLVVDGAIGDATWEALAAELDDRQLTDLVFTVGAYDVLAVALRSFRVELDDDLPREKSSPSRRSLLPPGATAGVTAGVTAIVRTTARRTTRMPHFTKPAEGSWTEHHGIDTGPVSYDDSISPAHYELERDAIFRRTWLNVGRVEQLPRNGSYFTRELEVARTSVVVVRDMGGDVRAFHNMCRHRGNKLVWNDYPRDEVSGTCRQFTCKYHGWRYALDGQLTFVQQETEFFDLDKADFGLVPVRCEVWEGFVFVNLDDEDTTPVRDYLGGLAEGIAGYPFHHMTQVHRYRA